jgi:hypothetical protein
LIIRPPIGAQLGREAEHDHFCLPSFGSISELFYRLFDLLFGNFYRFLQFFDKRVLGCLRLIVVLLFLRRLSLLLFSISPLRSAADKNVSFATG